MANLADSLVEAGPLLLDGAVVTLELTILSAVVALAVSFIFGLMALSPWVIVRFVSRVFTEFFRGTSLLVQLFWLFYVMPLAFGITLHPIAAAVIGLGLNYGAYGSEVVRGSITAVPPTQWEATVALNLSCYQRMRRVILPQAIVTMIPSFSNWLIQLLKGTALASLITITELTRVIHDYRVSEGATAAAFGAALVLYFLMAQVLAWAMRALERRAKAHIGQQPEHLGLFAFLRRGERV
jgi:polar amino acid transport system permease protein